MKKTMITVCLLLILAACENKPNKEREAIPGLVAEQQSRTIFNTKTVKKCVKDLKETNEVHTSYHYKYDILNSKFRQQPSVHSESNYFVVYTDGTHAEVSRDEWLGYSKGDSVQVVVNY